MAKIILSPPDVATPIQDIVRPQRTHLVFLVEAGTQGVIIQMCNVDKDFTVQSNWRSVGYIGPTSDTDYVNQQALATFNAKGYVYRVRVQGTTNTDVIVSYGEQTEAPLR